MKKLLLVFLLATTGRAQIGGVSIAATNTQILVRGLHPAASSCTIDLKDATATTVPDIAHAGGGGAGPDVVPTSREFIFVIGQRKYVHNGPSLALRAASAYAGTITCGSDTHNFSATTATIPFGSTRGEPLQVESPGVWAYPSIGTSVGQKIIDSQTGALLKRLTRGGARWSPSGGSLCHPVKVDGGRYCRIADDLWFLPDDQAVAMAFQGSLTDFWNAGSGGGCPSGMYADPDDPKTWYCDTIHPASGGLKALARAVLSADGSARSSGFRSANGIPFCANTTPLNQKPCWLAPVSLTGAGDGYMQMIRDEVAAHASYINDDYPLGLWCGIVGIAEYKVTNELVGQINCNYSDQDRAHVLLMMRDLRGTPYVQGVRTTYHEKGLRWGGSHGGGGTRTSGHAGFMLVMMPQDASQPKSDFQGPFTTTVSTALTATTGSCASWASSTVIQEYGSVPTGGLNQVGCDVITVQGQPGDDSFYYSSAADGTMSATVTVSSNQATLTFDGATNQAWDGMKIRVAGATGQTGLNTTAIVSATGGSGATSTVTYPVTGVPNGTYTENGIWFSGWQHGVKYGLNPSLHQAKTGRTHSLWLQDVLPGDLGITMDYPYYTYQVVSTDANNDGTQTDWVILRGHLYNQMDSGSQKGPAAQSAPWTLKMNTNAYDLKYVNRQGGVLWDAVAYPYPTTTSDPGVFRNRNTSWGHGYTTEKLNANMNVAECGGPSCFGVKTAPDLESLYLKDTFDFLIYATLTFGGKRGLPDSSNSIDSHAGVVESPDPSVRHHYMLDGRPMQKAFNGVHTVDCTVGQRYCYRPTDFAASPFWAFRHFDWFAYAAQAGIQDMSGPTLYTTPGTGAIGDTSADANRGCFVMRANECVNGSQPGDVYINATGISSTGAQYVCCGDPSETNDIGFGAASAVSHVMEQVLVLPTLNGQGRRTISRGLKRGYRKHNTFDVFGILGESGAFITNDVEGTYDDAWSAEIPPMLFDSVNRSTFIPIPVGAPSLPSGAARARVKFGYDSSYRCMQRNEACYAVSRTLNETTPFLWAHELTASSGDNTNAWRITIPAISGRMLWYQVEFVDAGGSVVATLPATVQAVQ